MAQFRFYNFEDALVSGQEILRWLGVLDPGVVRGFDTHTVSGQNIDLVHNLTGITQLTPDESSVGPTGILVTTQGTIIHETTSVTVGPFSTNAASSQDRYDLVYLEHTHNDTTGGVAATYAVIQGPNDNANARPTVTNNTQIPIGYLKIPAGEINLNNSEWIPVFGKTFGGKDIVDNGKNIVVNNLLSPLKGTVNVLIGSNNSVPVTDKNRFTIDVGASVTTNSTRVIKSFSDAPVGTEIVVDFKTDTDPNSLYTFTLQFNSTTAASGSIPIRSSAYSGTNKDVTLSGVRREMKFRRVQTRNSTDALQDIWQLVEDSSEVDAFLSDFHQTDGDWQLVQPQGSLGALSFNPDNAPSFSPQSYSSNNFRGLSFRYKAGTKEVFVNGAFNGIGNNVNAGRLTTLPTDMYPTKKVIVPVQILDSNAIDSLTLSPPPQLQIFPNGDVFLNNHSFGSTVPTGYATTQIWTVNASWVVD